MLWKSVTPFVLATALTWAGATARDQLVIGINQYPTGFHPSINSMAVKSYVLGMARRPLTTFDADWQPVCLLCTELPSLDNGTAVEEPRPDGSLGIAVTYTLDPDARWGDGTPVTTEDVLFSWEAGRHPESGYSNASLFRDDIIDITVHDAKTFTVHRDRRICDYGILNDFQILPAHLERPIFEAAPGDYWTRSRYQTEPTNPGLYFGPYRIAETVTGSHIVLVRNETWVGIRPAFDRVIVRAIENTAALEANLLAGDIDYIPGEVGLPLDQALALSHRHGDRFEIEFKAGLFYEHIDLNLDNPILADLRVRRALLLGIDRQTISDRLFDGQQPVAHGSIHPLDRIYDGSVPKTPFDPAAARTLLDEAGWQPGPGGIRISEAGDRLALDLMTTAGNRSRELVQQVLQQQWADIGVDIRINNQPPRVLFGQTLRERRFSGMALFAWLSSPQNVPRTILHSESIPTAANGYAGQNYTGIADPALDQILEDLEIVCESKRQQSLWSQLQHRYAKLLPVLPLYYRADAYIKPPWLKGIEPTGHQYASTLWIETWRTEP